ncbi:MAG: hypothetical protein HY906_09135 [Deltaproteobacteria bacterium]|nr:hypothetical protein [Deltaproteobacteria bacterium]
MALLVRSSRRSLAHFVAFASLAAAIRATTPHLPANWYVDYLPPPSAVQEPFMNVRGGWGGFLHLLGRFLDVPPSVVFGVSTACSSLAVGLLVATFLRFQERGSSRWPRHTPVFLGLLMSLDAIQVWLGASDAPHNVALLAFTLGLFWYAEALAASRAARRQWPPLAGVLACAALVGLTRVELLLSPVAYPLLLCEPGPRARGVLARLGTLVSAMGLVLLLRLYWLLGPGTLPGPPDVLSAGLRRAIDAHSPLTNILFPLSDWTQAGLLLLFIVACLSRRGLGLLLTPLAYAVLVLPKIVGGFGEARLGAEPGPAHRYDIILEALLLLMLAAGAAQGAEWVAALAQRFASRVAQRVVLVSAILVSVCLWLKQAVQAGALLPYRPLPYQAEYDFLRDSLARVPRGGRIVAVWARTVRGRDLDTALAIPHALLITARPDLEWRVIPPGSVVPSDRPLYFYRGATCSLDPAATPTVTAPSAAGPDREIVAGHIELCRSLDQRVERWLAQRRVSVRPMTWPLRAAQVDLGIGKLAP